MNPCPSLNSSLFPYPSRICGLFRYVRFAFLCALAAVVPPVMAGDGGGPTESELLESMRERLPAIMELKLAGKVGETNRALLTPRGDLDRKQRQLVEAENGDRIAFYRKVAARLGVSLEAVQKKRAKQIREASPEGVWVQSAKGEWERK